jgi:hypothetical protein
MPHDSQSDDPQPVIHIMQTPMYVNQSDGTVRAYYAGEEWYVVGADRDDAMQLRDEFDRRIQDPAYIADHLTRAKNHLYGGEVTPGFVVDAISQADYQSQTAKLGDKLGNTLPILDSDGFNSEKFIEVGEKSQFSIGLTLEKMCDLADDKHTVGTINGPGCD